MSLPACNSILAIWPNWVKKHCVLIFCRKCTVITMGPERWQRPVVNMMFTISAVQKKKKKGGKMAELFNSMSHNWTNMSSISEINSFIVAHKWCTSANKIPSVHMNHNLNCVTFCWAMSFWQGLLWIAHYAHYKHQIFKFSFFFLIQC